MGLQPQTFPATIIPYIPTYQIVADQYLNPHHSLHQLSCLFFFLFNYMLIVRHVLYIVLTISPYSLSCWWYNWSSLSSKSSPCTAWLTTSPWLPSLSLNCLFTSIAACMASCYVTYAANPGHSVSNKSVTRYSSSRGSGCRLLKK